VVSVDFCFFAFFGVFSGDFGFLYSRGRVPHLIAPMTVREMKNASQHCCDKTVDDRMGLYRELLLFYYL